MGGLPKRTGLKTDPEDAGHYQKYHDEVVSALKKGYPADQVRTELVTQGVPDKTARRIVIAVEQELTLAGAPKASKSSGPFVLFSWVALLLLTCVGSYVAWQAGRENHVQWRAGIPVAVLVAVVARAILRRRDIP